jgi:hypothetical protein
VLTGSHTAARCLAIIRTGAASLHGSYTAGPRNFDFALSTFVDHPPNAEGARFVHRAAGSKWVGLLATLVAHREVISTYDYIWLPDDDLRATPDAINRLFERCRQYDLELAQPALTRDSYFSHLITLEHTACSLRFTNFIEVMAPLCSRSLLDKLLPSLQTTVSGWGLDFVWPRFSCLGRVAIVDDALITHTRPVGAGNAYDHNLKAGLAPAEELQLVAARYGIDSFTTLNFGAITREGARLALTGGGSETESMITALFNSTVGLPVLPTELVRYLGRHVGYVRNEPLGDTVNRAFLKAALDLHFSKVDAPSAP